MATFNSELDKGRTSWIDGSSQISVEQIERSFDIEHLFYGAVITGKILGVETHFKIFLN